jgi:toxin ParE1/3/4
MEIVWGSTALDDLEHLRAYIAEDDPAAAKRTRTTIISAIASLREAPNRGRHGRVSGTRELVIRRTHYIAAYTVIGKQVRILTVLHEARPWPIRFVSDDSTP